MSPTVTTTSTNNISPIAEKERTKRRPHTRSVKMSQNVQKVHTFNN